MQYQRTLTRLTLFGAAFLVVLVLPQTSRAQSQDRVGVVQRLQGDVSIVHFGGSAMALRALPSPSRIGWLREPRRGC